MHVVSVAKSCAGLDRCKSYSGQGGVSKAVLVMHCSSKHVQIAMGYTCKLKGTRYVRAPFMLAAPLPNLA